MTPQQAIIKIVDAAVANKLEDAERVLEDYAREAFNAARKTDVNSLSHFDQKPYPLYLTFELYTQSKNKQS